MREKEISPFLYFYFYWVLRLHIFTDFKRCCVGLYSLSFLFFSFLILDSKVCSVVPKVRFVLVLVQYGKPRQQFTNKEI
jgi:hypothetical protein